MVYPCFASFLKILIIQSASVFVPQIKIIRPSPSANCLPWVAMTTAVVTLTKEPLLCVGGKGRHVLKVATCSLNESEIITRKSIFILAAEIKNVA